MASEGYAFQVEMTTAVIAAGGRVVEIPIVFTDRLHGRSKLSRGVVLEALVSVAAWGVSDRILRRSRRQRP